MVKENEMFYKQFLNKYRWKENPFTLTINPKLFVGYKKQVNEIEFGIENKDKIILLLGPTGSGKTTLLSYLCYKRENLLYISKPPKKQEEIFSLAPIFKKKLNFFQKLFFKPPQNPYELIDYLSKKIKRPLYLIIDEAHETEIEVLEWLRVLSDQIENLNIIFSALLTFEDKLKKLETLNKRVVRKVFLNALSKEETKELIRKRIEWVGGEDISPFNEEIIEYIFKETGGFPRDILVLCNKLINNAIENQSFELEIPKLEYEESKIELDILKDLPKKQKFILEIISNYEPISTSEIIEKIDLTRYPSKAHALRAINNILKKLMNAELIERSQIGKHYKYRLTPKTRTLLIKS